MFENLDQSRDGGLSSSEVDKLGEAFRNSDGVSAGPGSDPSEVVENLRSLSDQGIDDFVDAGGEGTGLYRGIAGETQDAKRYIDSGADSDKVEIQADIDDEAIEDEYSEAVAQAVESNSDFKNPGKGSTDIDVDTDTDVDVDGETLTSPATESKNLSPDGPPPSVQLTELPDKLSTWAASGEDELVVSVNREYLDTYEDADLLDEDYLETEIESRLTDLDSNVADDIDTDVNVNVVTHEQVGN